MVSIFAIILTSPVILIKGLLPSIVIVILSVIINLVLSYQITKYLTKDMVGIVKPYIDENGIEWVNYYQYCAIYNIELTEKDLIYVDKDTYTLYENKLNNIMENGEYNVFDNENMVAYYKDEYNTIYPTKYIANLKKAEWRDKQINSILED